MAEFVEVATKAFEAGRRSLSSLFIFSVSGRTSPLLSGFKRFFVRLCSGIVVRGELQKYMLNLDRRQAADVTSPLELRLQPFPMSMRRCLPQCLKVEGYVIVRAVVMSRYFWRQPRPASLSIRRSFCSGMLLSSVLILATYLTRFVPKVLRYLIKQPIVIGLLRTFNPIYTSRQ